MAVVWQEESLLGEMRFANMQLDERGWGPRGRLHRLGREFGCATADELEVISSSGVMLSSSQYK